MKIKIKNLKLYIIIGILENERWQKQQVILNGVIKYKYKKDFIDYRDLIESISNLLQKSKYGLLEVALQDISKKLMKKYETISKITLELEKPDIFDNCIVSIKKTFKR